MSSHFSFTTIVLIEYYFICDSSLSSRKNTWKLFRRITLLSRVTFNKLLKGLPKRLCKATLLLFVTWWGWLLSRLLKDAELAMRLIATSLGYLCLLKLICVRSSLWTGSSSIFYRRALRCMLQKHLLLGLLLMRLVILQLTHTVLLLCRKILVLRTTLLLLGDCLLLLWVTEEISLLLGHIAGLWLVLHSSHILLLMLLVLLLLKVEAILMSWNGTAKSWWLYQLSKVARRNRLSILKGQVDSASPLIHCG